MIHFTFQSDLFTNDVKILYAIGFTKEIKPYERTRARDAVQDEINNIITTELRSTISGMLAQRAHHAMPYSQQELISQLQRKVHRGGKLSIAQLATEIQSWMPDIKALGETFGSPLKKAYVYKSNKINEYTKKLLTNPEIYIFEANAEKVKA